MTIPQVDPFLVPIEKPQRLIMKLVYAMTRRQFGKVLAAPLKVFSARLLPLAFGLFTAKIKQTGQEAAAPARDRAAYPWNRWRRGD